MLVAEVVDGGRDRSRGAPSHRTEGDAMKREPVSGRIRATSGMPS
jgi:hypothetical protein